MLPPPMRVSRLMLVTLRDVPAEAEIPSHRLLLRAESEMEGLKPDDVVRSVLGAVEVPR